MPKTSNNKNSYLLFLAVVASLFLIFILFNSFIYYQKQGGGRPQSIERYQGQLTGEYVCLPHRDTSGPTTLECAFGLMTDSGEYYAVDFGVENTEFSEFVAGERVTLDGIITPIEMLSTDQWQKYNIQGIISVRPN